MFTSSRNSHRDEPDAFQVENGAWRILDGILALHVDDFLGGGENVNSVADIEQKESKNKKREETNPDTFLGRVQMLTQRYKFGSWNFASADGEIIFCGCQLAQSKDKSEISMSIEAYTTKVSPITVSKEKRQKPATPCTPAEISALRGLIGALQWPASQCSPHLQCTVSHLQSSVSDATIEDLLTANKALKFAKTNSDIKLYYKKIAPTTAEVLFGGYTEASWGSRKDGTSQGGLLIFPTTESQIRDGHALTLCCIDYKSVRLRRYARSSLSAETQAACEAEEALHWAKIMWALLINPSLTLREATEIEQPLGVLITDSRGLYDTSVKQTAGLGMAEKRTAIEAALLNQNITNSNTIWR